MRETGEIIRNLRIMAGFTQRDLAAALHVTDKAISKWERGVCLPDINLLPKLSLLLDTDIEALISKDLEQEKWIGLVDIKGCDFSQPIYDKPLIYYLLIHYLLVGITEIYVLTTDSNRRFLEREAFHTLGFNFRFDEPGDCKMMIMNHPWLIFGSDLTKQFKGAMLSGRNTKLVPEKQHPVMYFSCDAASYFGNRKRFMSSASGRTLGRGIVCFDMGDCSKAVDIAFFVRLYQENSGLLLGSLEEAAYNKNLIRRDQLMDIAETVPYGLFLRKLEGKPQVD